MAGSATFLLPLHFYADGVVHRCYGWEICAPSNYRFSALPLPSFGLLSHSLIVSVMRRWRRDVVAGRLMVVSDRGNREESSSGVKGEEAVGLWARRYYVVAAARGWLKERGNAGGDCSRWRYCVSRRVWGDLGEGWSGKGRLVCREKRRRLQRQRGEAPTGAGKKAKRGEWDSVWLKVNSGGSRLCFG
jgi:hypothetical protein